MNRLITYKYTDVRSFQKAGIIKHCAWQWIQEFTGVIVIKFVQGWTLWLCDHFSKHYRINCRQVHTNSPSHTNVEGATLKTKQKKLTIICIYFPQLWFAYFFSSVYKFVSINVSQRQKKGELREYLLLFLPHTWPNLTLVSATMTMKMTQLQGRARLGHFLLGLEP